MSETSLRRTLQKVAEEASTGFERGSALTTSACSQGLGYYWGEASSLEQWPSKIKTHWNYCQTWKSNRDMQCFCVVFSLFYSSGQKRDFIRNLVRSNWNLKIQVTPYDQEHLLSSQAEQGRGKSRHSRPEKWISSKCGAATLSWKRRQNRISNFCFAWLLSWSLFLIKESAVFMHVHKIMQSIFQLNTWKKVREGKKVKSVSNYSNCKKRTLHKT